MKREVYILLASACLFTAPVYTLQAAAPFFEEQNKVLALNELTAAPPFQDAERFVSDKNLRAVFFDALPYNGRSTKVFAWLGFPVNVSGPVPAVVLVHGGGGTAWKEWVQKWNEHGFAAISIAVEGQTDEHDASGVSGKWKRHTWAGPSRINVYGDLNQPLKNQWMYHAVADTILANSLMRSLPNVDVDHIGVVGVSWGGVITATVIGIDDRFRFAIPVYGCGHMFDARNHWGEALSNNAFYRQVWDPMVRMSRVTIPTQWLSWPEDRHFPMDCLSATYLASSGPHSVTLIPGMKHSQAAGMAPPDSYAFAASVVKTGEPWSRQTAIQVKDGDMHVEFVSSKAFDSAKLISTVDSGFTGDRNWTESVATLIQKEGGTWSVSVALPDGTTAAFINLYSDSLTISSDYWSVE